MTVRTRQSLEKTAHEKRKHSLDGSQDKTVQTARRQRSHSKGSKVHQRCNISRLRLTHLYRLIRQTVLIRPRPPMHARGRTSKRTQRMRLQQVLRERTGRKVACGNDTKAGDRSKQRDCEGVLTPKVSQIIDDEVFAQRSRANIDGNGSADTSLPTTRPGGGREH